MARKEAEKPVNSATTPKESIFSDDRVRSRAYEIYDRRRRSGVYGNATADWIAAERQLRARDDVDQDPAAIGADSIWPGYE